MSSEESRAGGKRKGSLVNQTLGQDITVEIEPGMNQGLGQDTPAEVDFQKAKALNPDVEKLYPFSDGSVE